jgi:telomerase reverse transcriptase
VTAAVIPIAFWGCSRNLKLILQRKVSFSNDWALDTKLWVLDVNAFIKCRRFETLSLHHILQGFSTSKCTWLMPSGKAFHGQTRVSVSDALKRRELLEEFIFWYFDSFVSSLLKVFPYHGGLFRTLILSRRIFISQNHQHFEIECSTSAKTIGKHYAHL